MCEVYHYENGKLLGSIPEMPHTYSVVQFMNEYQVAIGETTFGGLDSLSRQPGAFSRLWLADENRPSAVKNCT